MDKLFGQLPNLAKYGAAGEVVAFVGSAKDADQNITQLPTSMRALYSASELLQRDKKLFEICLKVHPTRKSPDEPQSQWGAIGNMPLIHPHATAQEIDSFVERWFGFHEVGERSSIPKKQMVLLAKVYVSKDLFKFDKKTGKHLGGIDMPHVQELLADLQKRLGKENSVAVEDDLAKIKTKYFRTKDKAGPAAKIRAKPSQRIVKGKKYPAKKAGKTK